MTFTHCIYKTLITAAEKAGYNLALSKRKKIDNDHESILPIASYAPWLLDHSFNETYQIVNPYTLVDKYRCYELWQLVGETEKLNGSLIEVGVWKGGSGALIAQKARLSGIKDTVYLCDTFKGVVKAGENDSKYVGGEHSDTSQKIVEGLMDKLRLDNVKVVAGVFPEETKKLIGDKAFRFCHIDVDVYQSAKDILDWVWPKMVVGGVIVFDDYGFQGLDGITRLVNEERRKKDRITLYNLNGHALLIKIAALPSPSGH